MKGFIDSISELSGLPVDLITGYRYIVLNGKGVYVEGIRNIRNYTDTELTVTLKKGMLVITGSNLFIKHLNSDEVLVTGEIDKVERAAK